MQDRIFRVEVLESQGIVVKGAISFTYEGHVFKRGVSFSQHCRQVAIDLLAQRLADGDACVLIENDCFLTLFHQQASFNQQDVVPSLDRESDSESPLPDQSEENSTSDFLNTQLTDNPNLSSSANFQAPEIAMSSDPPIWMRPLINQLAQSQNLPAILNQVTANIRSLLEVDRVNICQLQSDETVQVIAESLCNNRFSSLLAAFFPLLNLLPYPPVLLLRFGVGAMVNVQKKTILQLSPLNFIMSDQAESTGSLRLSAHSIQQLAEMGVHISLTMPIFHHETVWGLLIAHHSEERFIATRKLKVLKRVIDQLSNAITRNALQSRTQSRNDQETVITPPPRKYNVSTIHDSIAVVDETTTRRI
ncbi:MAG: GAF domain-containing protein [Leptolyngbyaceae cyanobacterium MO_188.B28]|nr:GAF domain-containing protein [Leptolyngbyaceae cyanobacterium MO_188.B28]